jgi:hypothetical protein
VRARGGGERSVGLGVDAASDTGAFRFDELAGMAPTFRWVIYEEFPVSREPREAKPTSAARSRDRR